MSDVSNTTQLRAAELARQIIAQKPVYIDTETTGLEKDAEVIEISIVDWNGAVLFTSLVKPTRPIPADAQRVHHIKDSDVAASPAWPILWPRIRSFLYGRPVAAYNAPFDYRMMQQSHARYRLPWRDTLNMVDVLPLYSDYRGVWDPVRRSMKYFKLEEAGAYFKIPLLNEHRSAADALLVRALLHSIAGQAY
jgi:DNA polymerase III, epsilon subunit and related 3''-5'' exonucleases